MVGTSFKNFIPGTTVSLGVTTTTGVVALGTSPATRRDVMLYNTGTTLMFVKFGKSDVQAAVTDTPLPAGTMPIFHAGDATHVAAIMLSSTATLYATVGFGN